MSTQVLLGDEAVALAALHSRIGGAFSYPGTPATEIFEYVAAHKPLDHTVQTRWSANEKVAYEEALGMSWAGRRALVSMKHVGLNVAADPFMSSSLTGVHGGIVLAVADDPGMHSSQNEQDSRFFADFAKIPCFEPSNQQECYDLTCEAFRLSERVKLPVMVRLVTRLAHSRSDVVVNAQLAGNGREDLTKITPDWRDWTLLPANARRRYRRVLDLQKSLVENAEKAGCNRLTLAGRRGIITSGIAYNYVRDALGSTPDVSLLKISAYPIPVNLVRRLVDHCEEIFVIEDGYPLIESRLVGLLGLPGKAVRGKLTGELPPSGELTPEIVAAALGNARPAPVEAFDDLAARMPQLCKGCAHGDAYKAITTAVASYPRPVQFSDIGCYTLGALPPYNAVHACVDMGASISMSHGAAQAGAFPVICTIGDSTFTHSGITALLGAARADADMTVVILDNSFIAMTGGQESLASGEDMETLIRGLGVAPDHLHVIEPLPKNHSANVELLNREINHRGLSVIIARRACIQAKRRASGARTELHEPVGAETVKGTAT